MARIIFYDWQAIAKRLHSKYSDERLARTLNLYGVKCDRTWINKLRNGYRDRSPKSPRYELGAALLMLLEESIGEQPSTYAVQPPTELITK